MKTALWTVQVLWGVFFSITGFGKVLCYKPALWTQALHEVPWFSAVPQDLFIFIGVCEFLERGFFVVSIRCHARSLTEQ